MLLLLSRVILLTHTHTHASQAGEHPHPLFPSSEWGHLVSWQRVV